MMKKIIYLASTAALLVVGAAISQETQDVQVKHTADRHKDRGITCGACHGGEAAPKEAASPKTCLTCKNHGSWDIADKRIKDNKEYKFNPHRNHISEANDLECTMCHQAHGNDTIFCYNCHQGIKFK